MRKHIMVCVSGFSGSGKDEFMSRLVSEHGAVQTGLADPAKRHMADLYGWSEEQLFGPSKFRNAGDLSIPKQKFRDWGLVRFIGEVPEGIPEGEYHTVTPEPEDNGKFSKYASVAIKADFDRMFFIPNGDPDFWLSPREALQRYCETMNELYGDSWIRKGIEDQKKIVQGGLKYSRMKGVLPAGMQIFPVNLTGFADFRHIHEYRMARSEASEELTPVLIRVKRPSVPTAPYQHRSETEQTRVRDAAFDFIVENSGSVTDLHNAADHVLAACSNPKWVGKIWSESFVLEETSKRYVP